MIRLTVLTQIAAIHQATAPTLPEVGIVPTHPEAREILSRDGARRGAWRL
jgi:trimethylamine:corrinoid methyltransferase-like protein